MLDRIVYFDAICCRRDVADLADSEGNREAIGFRAPRQTSATDVDRVFQLLVLLTSSNKVPD
jgi:hypothetical protein